MMEKQRISIVEAKDSEDFLRAKNLILEYTTWLGMDLSFQNFSTEIDNLERMYSKPGGGLLLAMVDGEGVGVAGIRKYEGKECELKRMFVRTRYRNLGLGKLLVSAAIDLAKKLDYQVIKLDTADFMTAAIKLYTGNGFVEIAAYRHNPHESAKYFELILK